MSYLFHVSPVAPPSYDVCSVTSVPLWGRDHPCSSPRQRRRRPAAPGPLPGGLHRPHSPAARHLSQFHAQSHRLIIFQLKSISYQQHVSKPSSLNWIGKTWEVTPLQLHIAAPTTCPTSLSLLRFPPSSSTFTRLWGSTCSKRRTAPTLPSRAACRMSPPQRGRNSGSLAVADHSNPVSKVLCFLMYLYYILY